ncbi:MAG: DNA polymerase III subunit gamma and tau [Gordonia sp. (in: high G+C Gram-positive bacteria)]
MALYRTYRPATFAEVVGQEHVTDPLSRALDTGRINHAYLFSGPRGCGKTSSARILARSLNCEQGPTSTPCGTCSSCVSLGPGGPGNLDVVELDAASHGGVDDTRDLRDRAFFAPAESRYRVFIIDEAHMVSSAGFNALLKIVEEPPEHLIFIFATTEPEKVLTTIRSRTHHYPFRLLAPPVMRGLLERICASEGVKVAPEVYPLVIRAGGGSPRDSLSILDQLLAGAGEDGVKYERALSLLGVTDVALIDDAVDALAAGDGAALFGVVERVVDAGHDPRRFAIDLLDRFRDLLLLQAVPDAAERSLVEAPEDQVVRMRSVIDYLGPATLTRYAEVAHASLGEMRGTTSPRLLLEVMCSRLLLPSASTDDAALLQRIETLEKRPAGAAPAGAASVGSGPAAPAADEPPSRFVRKSQREAQQRAEAQAAQRREAVAQDEVVEQAAEQARQAEAERAEAERAAAERAEAERVAAERAETERQAAAAREAEEAKRAEEARQAAEAEEARKAAEARAEAEARRAAEAARVRETAPAEKPPTGPAEAVSSPFDDDIPLPSEPFYDPAYEPIPEPEPEYRSRNARQTPAQRTPARQAPAARESEPARREAPEPAAQPRPTAPADERRAAAPVAAAVAAGALDDVAPEVAADGPVASGAVEPSAPAGLTVDAVTAKWPDIRAAVREQRKAFEPMLSAAFVRNVEGASIQIGHPHRALVERMSLPQSAAVLDNAVQQVFGAGHRVQVVHAQPAAPGAAGRPESAKAERRQTYTRPSRPQPEGQGGSAAESQPEPEEPWQAPEPRPDEDLTDDERDEMVAQAQTGKPDERLDPTHVALELLKSELGARPVE